MIEDPSVPAMRTEHAFAVGMRRPGLLLVDDAAAEGADHWAAEGATLLTRLAAGSHVRFVCPVPEPGRAVLAARLGLTCVETWWHRDLPHRSARSAVQESRRVRLVPAPPIYAPGGPVLFVAAFRGRCALAEMEEEAAVRGATVSVVTQSAGDGVREELLSSVGYRRTCDFYEGKACVTRT